MSYLKEYKGHYYSVKIADKYSALTKIECPLGRVKEDWWFKGGITSEEVEWRVKYLIDEKIRKGDRGVTMASPTGAHTK